MTTFERAMVAAYLARREHGEASPEYREALARFRIEKLAHELRQMRLAAKRRRRDDDDPFVPVPEVEKASLREEGRNERLLASRK